MSFISTVMTLAIKLETPVYQFASLVADQKNIRYVSSLFPGFQCSELFVKFPQRLEQSMMAARFT